MPVPPTFHHLHFMMWRTCNFSLVMISLLIAYWLKNDRPLKFRKPLNLKVMVVRRDDGPSRRDPGGDRELQEGHQPQQDEPGKISIVNLRIFCQIFWKKNKNDGILLPKLF